MTLEEKRTPEEKRILRDFDVVLLPLRCFIQIIERGSERDRDTAEVLTVIENRLYQSLEEFIDGGHQKAPEGGE